MNARRNNKDPAATLLNRRRRCSAWVIAILCGLTINTAFAAEFEADRRHGNLHGPLEYLQESLLQSPEDARLLDAAKRQLAAGDRVLAFQALQAVFAQPHDSFTPVVLGNSSSSTYEVAFDLLRNADFRTRVAWFETTERWAADALQQATINQDEAAVRRVARMYPFTESGLKALAVQAVRADSRGQTLLANSILADMEAAYTNTSVAFRTQPLLTTLRHRIRSESRSAPEPGHFAGEPPHRPPKVIEFPWPSPLWQWKEDVWKSPTAASIFGGLSLPSERRLLTSGLWRPALTTDSIILRTPLRLICFEKKTGNVTWSLPTNTFAARSPLSDAKPGSPGTVRDILKTEELGAVSVDNDLLFFIDNFRNLAGRNKAEDKKRSEDDNRRLFLTGLLKHDGSRLVAVRLKPTPKVLWTVGDSPDFDYQFTNLQVTSKGGTASPSRPSHGGSQNELAPEVSSVSATDAFKNQHFAGIPLLHDQMLFVLSADDDVTRLSCLSQGTGRIHWQKPLSYEYDDGSVGMRIRQNYEADAGASLCGISGNVIVCALKNGVILGTSVTDGQLLWATNVRDEISSQGRRKLNSQYRTASVTNDGTFRPMIRGTKLFWSSPQSEKVHCVDIPTGKILWKAPRQVVGTGELEGSKDKYAAAVTSAGVVLFGQRHARLLSIDDGSQEWAVKLQQQSGRAACNGEQCLVPQQDGTIVLLDARDGSKRLATGMLTEMNQESITGTIQVDDDIVCSSTPLSVCVMPTVNFVRNEKTSDQNSDRLLAPKLRLLSGDVSGSISELKRLASTSQGIEPEEAALLAETLLQQQMADRLNSSEHSKSNVKTKDYQGLPLSLEQRLRFQLLNPNPETPQPTAERNLQPLLKLAHDWQVRADIARRVTFPAKQNNNAEFSSNQIRTLSNLEQAILNPSNIGSPQQQADFSDRLVDAGHETAAEHFLLTSLRHATSDSQAVLRSRLQRLRGAIDPAESPLLVPTDAEFRVEESLELASESRLIPVLLASRAFVPTPNWFRQRFLVVNRKFHTASLSTGAVSLPTTLPTTLESSNIDYHDETPGLIPVVNNDHVGVISLLEANGPKMLWWDRIEKEATNPGLFKVGPFGADYLIVSGPSQIECRHPFTGQVLWRRSGISSSPTSNRYRRTKRVFGDHQVIAIMGQNGKSCTRFRTSDGSRLSDASFRVPSGQAYLTSGRRMLYEHDNLPVLIDLAAPEEHHSIDASDKNSPIISWQLLANHRAATISEAGELLVMDMRTGDITIRCSLGKKAGRRNSTSLKSIERDGRLYVMTGSRERFRAGQTASSIMRDFRLDYGTLYCINPENSEVVWQRRSEPSVMPELYGDKSNLMLFWSWEDLQHPVEHNSVQQFTTQQRTHQKTNRALVLTVADSNSGKTLAKHRHLGPFEPLRCVHNGEKKTVVLHTSNSKITVSYGG